jgi:hypothetical protein
VQIKDLASTVVLANVFNGSDATQVSMRVGEQGEWKPMEQVTLPDPAFLAEKLREQALSDRTWVDLPEPHPTPHLWRGMLPTNLLDGSHLIQIQVEQGDRSHTARRVIRVQTETK